MDTQYYTYDLFLDRKHRIFRRNQLEARLVRIEDGKVMYENSDSNGSEVFSGLSNYLLNSLKQQGLIDVTNNLGVTGEQSADLVPPETKNLFDNFIDLYNRLQSKEQDSPQR